MKTEEIINKLKSIQRFNLNHYREGEYGIDTERENTVSGDYIDSYEIDDLIKELESSQEKEFNIINEELALSYLLLKGYCILDDLNSTTRMYVKCNDIFYYDCEEAECFYNSEIISLYKMVKESPKYGWLKFCALKRKMRPVPELIDEMKKNNYWDDELESLPKR